MFELFRGGALVLAVITMGIVTGVLQLYSHTVMPGLGRTDDRTFVGAFQAIDRAIINPLFLATFLGAFIFTGLAVALSFGASSRSMLPWLVAALVLYLAVLVITFRINVPLNDAIKAAGAPDRITDLAAVRERFNEAQWIRWNTVRAVASTAAPAELAALRARPLRLPTLAAGEACPVTHPAPPDPPPPSGHPLSTGRPPSALGHAPVFPDARYFRGDRAQLWVRAETTHPGWYSAKVPWASRTGYLGWVLIRTGRLDGPGRARVGLRLADGTAISEALAVNVQADWQFWPGSTEVTAPGCYAYQVDGSSFIEIIVFRAELDPNRPPTTPA